MNALVNQQNIDELRGRRCDLADILIVSLEQALYADAHSFLGLPNRAKVFYPFVKNKVCLVLKS